MEMYLSMFLVLVSAVCYKGLHVHGPSSTVVAQLEGLVLLPCFSETPLPLEGLQVEWRTMDTDSLVSVFLQGKSRPDLQSPVFGGRCDFFPDEILKGNFSILLRNVIEEDAGGYRCKVNTSQGSSEVTMEIKVTSFSVLSILILMFCLIALLLAVGFCGPVFNLLRNKDTTNKGRTIHILLIFCPNICMFVAFCLWSKEGFLYEVITCSIVSIMRPILLMKTSSCLDTLPEFLKKAVKILAIPLYHSSLVAGAISFFFRTQLLTQEIIPTVLTGLTVVFVIGAVGSAVFGLRVLQTVFLEVIITLLVALIRFGRTSEVDYNYEKGFVLPFLCAEMVIILTLQRHLFHGKSFKRMNIAVSSVPIAIFSLFNIGVYVSESLQLNNFGILWILPFDAILVIVEWIGVIYAVHCDSKYRKACCTQWKRKGYLICTAIAALVFVIFGIMAFCYVYLTEHKDRSGNLALIPLLQILTVTCLFKHPKYLPDVLHVIIYMFGAVGLSALNAIVLTTELILTAGKGRRTIDDLRVIVLPLETVFVGAWLVLQIYDAWRRFKDGLFQNWRFSQTLNLTLTNLSDQ